MKQAIDLVITGGSANALGALRSLGPHYRCLLLCQSAQDRAYHSRFGQRQLVTNTRTEQIVDDLLKLGPSFERKPVLLLTEEKTVLYVSQHRDKLQTYYQFLLPAHSQVVALQSKAEFQQLAEQHQAPIPKAVVLNQAGGLAQLSNLTFPCVFKPLEQNEAYSRAFKKAYKVQSAAEVEQLYQQIAPIMPDMIVQEWIQGRDSDIYFCLAFFDPQSQLVSSFTGRKLRSWPLNIGGTASCTGAPEAHAELSRLTADFARAIGYQGLIGVEFKFDASRQGYYLIEPTVGRTDYQHEIATLSGHNLLLDMARYFDGKPPVAKTSSILSVWRDPIADAQALSHGADPTEPAGARRYDAVFRWQDPGPQLADYWQRLTHRLGLSRD